MTDHIDREHLAVKALALAQIPALAACMGSWCGRHLATEDLHELVQVLEQAEARIARFQSAYEDELGRLRAERRANTFPETTD